MTISDKHQAELDEKEEQYRKACGGNNPESQLFHIMAGLSRSSMTAFPEGITLCGMSQLFPEEVARVCPRENRGLDS